MPYSDFVIFVDESGDHSLQSVDVNYPVFVLDFCIFQKTHFANVVVPNMEAFKFDHFGHDIVVLHERDIRKQHPPFAFLQGQQKREVFMTGLSHLIEVAEFTIVATVINKQRHIETYANPVNPYHLALKFCMERAFGFLRERDQHEHVTHIVVERRGKREDDELELAFHRIRDGSSYQGEMPGFRLVFADKQVNSSGLQLADLTARPIGRYVMDPEQPNRAWEVIRQKLFRSRKGDFDGYGLKVFP